jgi:hypothetical protein
MLEAATTTPDARPEASEGQGVIDPHAGSLTLLDVAEKTDVLVIRVRPVR